MNNALIVAIAKAISPENMKAASAKLSVGEHKIDSTLRIRGAIRKGEDYPQVVHMACDQWGMLAVALSKLNGVTMEAIVREAMDMTEEKIAEVKEQAKVLIEKYKRQIGTETCSGKVTKDNLVVEEVERFVEVVSASKAVKSPAKKTAAVRVK